MKRVVVAVYDSAVQAYMQPFFALAPAQAVRSFTDEVNRKDQQNQLWMHPEDFELRQLAEWDEAKGTFENSYRALVRGKDVRNDAP